MNKQRRKEVEKAIVLLEDSLKILDKVSSEEMDAFDNLPDNFRDGDMGQAMEDVMDCLSDATMDISSGVHSLKDLLL